MGSPLAARKSGGLSALLLLTLLNCCFRNQGGTRCFQNPSTGFIHVFALFIPTPACQNPLWEPIPGWFPFEKPACPEPSQLQGPGLLQAQGPELLRAQGPGPLQGWLCQMKRPGIRCVLGRSGTP